MLKRVHNFGPSRNASAFFALTLLLFQLHSVHASVQSASTASPIDPLSNDMVAKAVNASMTNQELETYLKDYANRCSNISQLTVIGNSVNGFPIYALEVSNNPGVLEPKANLKFVANIHGDETLGRTLTIGYAEWLCQNYMTDNTAKRIVDGLHLWFVPTLNPDGYAAQTRENSHGVDLNRNFPDHFTNPTCAPTGKEEPEVQAMMNFTQSIPFLASIAYHGGSWVCNYPWDGTANQESVANPSPDDKSFVYLCTKYSSANPGIMKNTAFKKGITNGAAWYAIYGGSQDWNYVRTGTMELTLEVGPKTPAEDQLASMFVDNFNSMLEFTQLTGFGGVRGKVYSKSKRTPVGRRLSAATHPVEAHVNVVGHDQVIHTVSDPKTGFYQRFLAPGKYTLYVQQNGSAPSRKVSVVIPAFGTPGSGVIKDFLV